MSESKHDSLDDVGKHGTEILNVRMEVAKRQGRLADIVDTTGRLLSAPGFFAVFLATHLGWVICNLPGMPWTPWDPYPFVFLATFASVEAPFIALLVLMHQHRQERINELRDELMLQIDLHIERKTSMTLRMLDDLYHRMGHMPDHDGLERLKHDLDARQLMQEVREELDTAEGEDDGLL